MTTTKKTGGQPVGRPRKAVQKKKYSPGKYLAIIGIVLGVIAIAALFFGYYNYSQQRALAKFDGEKITRDEFARELRLEAGKYDPLVWKSAEESSKIKREILDQMIRDRLLIAKAKELGIAPEKDELKAEINSYKSGYTEDTFRKMLEIKGIKYNDWVTRKKNKYAIQKLTEKEVVDKIELTPADIKKYYTEHKKDFSHPEQVRARHIVVSTWDEAQKIMEELVEGGNFAAIAKKKSTSPERWKGGDLGYFSRGVYPEVFDRICFNMPQGEISPVVKSEYGYHIFKVMDKRGPVNETLQEATDQIVTQLKRERSKEAFEKWFAPIYTAASININEDLLNRIEVTINGNEN